MATLQDLLGLATLYYGTRQQNRNIREHNRAKLAELQADRDLRRQGLLHKQQQEADEAKRKAQIARATQLRQAYTPLLNMGRTPADQAALSQQPERYQALLLDQADIAQMLASGDDSAWETFRPRFWGGQGFVAPPPPQAAPASPAIQSIWDAAGQAPAPRPQQAAPPAPPPMMTTDPLGNPLATPMPMTPQMGETPPPAGRDPLGNVIAPAGFQPPSWFNQPVPVPQKDAAGIRETDSKIKEREARLEPELRKLEAEIDLLRKRGKVADADAVLRKWQAVVAQGTPEWKERQTRALEASVGIRAAAQKETARHNLAGEQLTREGHQVTIRGQNLNAQQHAARLKQHAAGNKWSPQQLSAAREWADILTKKAGGLFGGDGSYESSDEERLNAWNGLKGMGYPMEGFTPPPGADAVETPTAAPGDSGSAGGFSQAQINAVSRFLNAGRIKELLQEATPEQRAQIEATVAHIRSQRKAKGRK